MAMVMAVLAMAVLAMAVLAMAETIYEGRRSPPRTHSLRFQICVESGLLPVRNDAREGLPARCV